MWSHKGNLRRAGLFRLSEGVDIISSLQEFSAPHLKLCAFKLYTLLAFNNSPAEALHTLYCTARIECCICPLFCTMNSTKEFRAEVRKLRMLTLFHSNLAASHAVTAGVIQDLFDESEKKSMLQTAPLPHVREYLGTVISSRPLASSGRQRCG